MSQGYAFQEIMNRKMANDKLSQNQVARMVSEKVGRRIYASAINRLLAEKPTIPAGDVLQALAELFETDPATFISSVYSSRYSGNDLLGMGDFFREKFDQADDARKRKIIEILREVK